MKKDVKQVLVWRNDLKVRKGKIAAQIAHASMGVFFQGMEKTTIPPRTLDIHECQSAHYWSMPSRPFFEEFITGAFKKIVVYVNSEEELLAIYQKAIDSGIHCSLIKDAGLTEFGGVPTYTAVGIGPWDSEGLNEITGHLPLL